eukprot:g14544.t1
MSAIAGFGSLKVAREGTAVSRNPILGINAVAFDEPGFDIEGNRGAGTRGQASLTNIKGYKTLSDHTDTIQYGSSSMPSSAVVNSQSKAQNQPWMLNRHENVERDNRGEVVKQTSIISKTYDNTDVSHTQTMQEKRNHGIYNADNKYYTNKHGALKSLMEGDARSRNPITGVGTNSYDEQSRDLDGRTGRGTRGHAGNRQHNHQNAAHLGRGHRNIITGEGLRAVHNKDRSDHVVIDGNDGSQYAYYQDSQVNYRPKAMRSTEMLGWDQPNYSTIT